MAISAPLSIRGHPAIVYPGHPAIFVPGDLMSAHRPGCAAEVAVQPGRQAAHRIPVGPKQVSAAAERRTSASANALRPLRYRDVGLAACISYGREEPPPGGCTPASSQDGRGSPTGSLTGCQRPPSSSRTQPYRAS